MIYGNDWYITDILASCEQTLMQWRTQATQSWKQTFNEYYVHFVDFCEDFMI